MKTFVPFILIIYLPMVAMAQMKVTFATSEVLDKYEKKFRHWGGDNETIRFLVVRKIIGTDTSTYVQCEVENKAWEKTGQSTGLAVGANGGWAVGIGDFETVDRKKGIISFFSKDYGMLISYLNQFLSISKAGDPEFDKTWTATFNERFSISLTFVQSRLSKWTYILSMDGANFEIDADDSLELIRKMAGFRKWLKPD